ncbi:MAG: hypothetical protein IJU72_03910 [Bacteroidales bacterium]|nr:hypothetical protein [Bacteroidales bacterium]
MYLSKVLNVSFGIFESGVNFLYRFDCQRVDVVGVYHFGLQKVGGNPPIWGCGAEDGILRKVLFISVLVCNVLEYR